MREEIARAIYEAPGVSKPWASLSDERRKGWLADADRVIMVLETLPMAGSRIEAGGGASAAKPPGITARKSSDTSGADNGDKDCAFCGRRPHS